MIGMYPSKLKVKRWPMNIFWHSIDLTMGNAWLLYQIEYKRKNKNDKYLAQFDFKRHVAECWMAQNACPTNRRLRNRLGRAGRASPVPQSIRYDTKNHLPDATCGATGRKQCAVCKACTNVYCTKCEVHLCMFSGRNCFKPFHIRPTPYHTRVRRVNNNADTVQNSDAVDVDTDQNSDAIDDVDSQEYDAAESQGNASTDFSEEFSS